LVIPSYLHAVKAAKQSAQACVEIRLAHPRREDASRQDRAVWIRVANASVGLFGIQIVWGLQNVTTSRIFQSLGAEMAALPLLWIAAPLSGLLVHPLIGWISDRTQGRHGRRRPYIAVGTGFTAAAMVFMGSASSLSVAVLALWMLSLAVNIAMQPMRALTADITPEGGLAKAYATQVVFIGAGAIFASCLPWLLARLPLSADLPADLRSSWRLAYFVGAATLVISVGWTLITTREVPRQAPPGPPTGPKAGRMRSGRWLTAGIAVAGFAAISGLRREVYLLAGLFVAYAALQVGILTWRRRHPDRPVKGMLEIVASIGDLPVVLRRLAVVQFFTWFGLFTAWVYVVPTIAFSHFAKAAPGSSAYDAAADWSGVLFGVQDAVAIVVAFCLPRLSRAIGVARCHAACLLIGAASFLAMGMTPNWMALALPWAGLGVAWASILSLPYAIVATAGPSDRVGLNLGVHNIFLVLPQLVGASLLGPFVHTVLRNQLDLIMPLAGAAFMIAAALAARLHRPDHGRLMQ